MQEGARNALLGYLYQFVGVASLRVREVAPGDDAAAQLIIEPGGAPPGSGTMCVLHSRHRHACVVVGCAGDCDLLDLPRRRPGRTWACYKPRPRWVGGLPRCV